MKLVTSLSPRRLGHQKSCIDSWIAAGFEVVAVQSKGESKTLESDFPEVTFVETDLVGDLFGASKHVRISALTQQAKEESILILNSDLKIVSSPEFQEFWKQSEDKELKVGIRHDRQGSNAMTLFKWGIDVFRVTPQIAADLPDIGMTIGQPAWDYWIPWHLFNKCGYKVTTSIPLGIQFVHNAHTRTWSNSQYQIGLKLFEQHYGISGKDLTEWIQEITGRKKLHTRKVSANRTAVRKPNPRLRTK